MKNLILLCGCIIIIIFSVSLFLFNEKFRLFDSLGRGIEPQVDQKTFSPDKEYTLTLGNWGKEEPAFCYQTVPEISENNLPTCNACKLACSSKKAENRCQTCTKML